MHALHTSQIIAHLLYLSSVVLFMLSIQLMSKVRTARRGNGLAALAMLLAMVGQLIEIADRPSQLTELADTLTAEGKTADAAEVKETADEGVSYAWIIFGVLIGGGIGTWLAVKRQFTEMPELVALLNGTGGLASAVVAIAAYFKIAADATGGIPPLAGSTVEMTTINAWALLLTVIVGGITFTGSMVAYAKLSEHWSAKIKVRGKALSQPIILPGRHWINGGMLAASFLFSLLVISYVGGAGSVTLMFLVTLLSLALGVGLVLAIGGGDMPVVISLLNSYSGVAGALAGFAINSPVLVVSGSMVGAAGLILTQIMCKAMNRSLANVLFGGFGAVGEGAAGGGEYVGVRNTDPEAAAMMFADAQSMIIVPGYGLAVAQAQHAVRELADSMIKRGCKVRYAIHPVAGRMPGHMNVLLAEANVPYDQLIEMDEINKDFKDTDVVLVIGANDVVNPAALTDPQSPIYGMPILMVTEARNVYTIKRSLKPGFAGIKNELFEAQNNEMIFGDAKAVVEELTGALQEA